MTSITDIITLNPQNFNENTTEEIYNILVKIKLEEIPKKHLRKFLEVTIAVLKLKGDQILSLQDQFDSSKSNDEFSNARMINENQSFQRLTNKLESEKTALNTKMQEMSEEISSLQKRLQAESDADSSDPLSELDHQRELHKNISTKNKHIKRLIREIESLQSQNIEQSKTIIELEKKMQLLKSKSVELQNQTVSCESEKKLLNNSINDLTIEITRLEGNITYLEDERERSDLELKEFIGKLEERALTWRNIIDGKENQLDSLRKKYDLLKCENPEMMNESDDQDNNQFEKLVKALHERDGLIEELESKLKSMAEEMMTSTRIMSQISSEREAQILSDTKKNRTCCQQIEISLKASQKRCIDLEKMIDKTEEDNSYKSKQAIEAINALDSYQKGEDGLKSSLQKIAKLQQKLNSRDKQIKALVMELNSLHEISQENIILRKKLNIPDDMGFSTSNLVAKQRNKDKLIDRLNLKLRASEEIRLQLKIEKNDLKRDIMSLRQKLRSNQIEDRHTTKTDDSLEIHQEIYCDNCLKNIQTLPNRDSIIQDVIKEWEEKYSSVVEENENLRVGMHEILEKIREYELSSDHIKIDCSILEKVLHALDARSISGWYHPAMRIQNELIAVKEREHALKEKINFVNKVTAEGNQSSIEEPNADLTKTKTSLSQESSVEHKSDTPNLSPGTRTVSPKNFNEEKKLTEILPNAIEKMFENQNIENEFLKLRVKNRELQIENESLHAYKLEFSEMLKKFNDSELDVTKYCSTLIERITDLETKYNVQNKKYEYIKEDFETILEDYKLTEIKNITLIADLKKTVNVKKHEINMLKISNKKNLRNPDSDEMLALKLKYSKLNSKLAELIAKIFQNKLPGFELEESCSNFGIIKENMQLDFFTFEEFQSMKMNNEKINKEYNEVVLKCEHLEDQLSISEDQIKSEQKLIAEITDNQIELRHLVADLQSTNEDKFLISKSHRELKLAKSEISKIKNDKDILEHEMKEKQLCLSKTETEIENLKKDIHSQNNNHNFTIKFLKNYVFTLNDKYCKFTPLVYLKDFVSLYTNFIKKITEENQIEKELFKKIENLLTIKFQNLENSPDSQDLIKLVKLEMKCNLLEEQLSSCQQKLESSQNDLNALRISSLEDIEQWKIIQVLFSNRKESMQSQSQAVQTIEIETKNSSTNTNCDVENKIETKEQNSAIQTTSQEDQIGNQPLTATEICTEHTIQIKTMQCQLDKAISLASERSLLLLGVENKLAEAYGNIREMEKTITLQKELHIPNENNQNNSSQTSPAAANIETTINYLQSLIIQKDGTLLQYQDLLKIEKEQFLKSCETYDKQISSFKILQADLERTIKMKNLEITEGKILKKNLEQDDNLSHPNSNEQNLNEEKILKNNDLFVDNLNEISDEKIEEMFMDVDERKNIEQHSPDHELLFAVNESSVKENNDILIRDTKNRLIFWEKSIRAKDEEISHLKDKLLLTQEREKVKHFDNPEIEQLRILLEEKDKHINDLMDTLTSFHDDQQRFLSETSLYSTDQMTQLGTNLSRSETSNKILQTQLEALKRQLASLTQREKQVRDLANSLKNQLIKRPVVSIKTELNSKNKTEQQQKYIKQLEEELKEAKLEISTQKKIIDAKRSKNATEINMWEKQKQHQQNAERLKIKLDDSEKALSKCRSLLSGARNTISKLEKDKHLMELKYQKGTLDKCCRTPSCPNLFSNKFNLSDRQENYTGINNYRSDRMLSENSEIIINKLKHRIEAQQRRIYAYEIYAKGKNVMTLEFEKLQEKLSSSEAQNIRWEAKNLQLQLDNDLLRQGDENERLKKRIKHLEDYVLALKEELAKAAAQMELTTDQNVYKKTTVYENAEQTILALKRIVEKLKAENKNMKEKRGGLMNNVENKNRIASSEMTKLQQSYSEALKKISKLQIELQLKQNNDKDLGGGDFTNEFKFIKDQLIKKTQLLEKAKILLTRAAAKEKSLKDQLSIWKRKCSELQNVPVIEEISE